MDRVVAGRSLLTIMPVFRRGECPARTAGPRQGSDSDAEKRLRSPWKTCCRPPPGDTPPGGCLEAPGSPSPRAGPDHGRCSGRSLDRRRPDGPDGNGPSFGNRQPGGERLQGTQRQWSRLALLRHQRRRPRPRLQRQLHDARGLYSLCPGRPRRHVGCRYPQPPLGIRRLLRQLRDGTQAVPRRQPARHRGLLRLRRRRQPVFDLRPVRHRALRPVRPRLQPGRRVGRVAHRLRQPPQQWLHARGHHGLHGRCARLRLQPELRDVRLRPRCGPLRG